MKLIYIFENLSKNFIENQVSAIAITMLEKVYPIGAIYISSSTTNPKDIFGFGTWTQIMDRFILAAGSKYANGNTGGAATVTLTKNEMPSHNHELTDPGHSHSAYAYIDRGSDDNNHTGTNFGSGDTNGDGDDLNQTVTVQSSTTGITVNYEGGGQPHNNMPPYYSLCYIMKK